ALEQHAPPLCRRFIFFTGDTLSPQTLAFFSQSGVPRLTKPFPFADLRHIIHQVLQAQRARAWERAPNRGSHGKDPPTVHVTVERSQWLCERQPSPTTGGSTMAQVTHLMSNQGHLAPKVTRLPL